VPAPSPEQARAATVTEERTEERLPMRTEAECRIVRSGAGYEGKQGLSYGAGVSAESAGASGLCLHTLVVPPGGRGKAHLHEHHESAIYLIEGEGEMWWGEGLAHHELVNAGDFVYIPAGVPHLPANRSANVPMTAVIARTDPNEQESVVLLPELDALAVPPVSGARSAGSTPPAPPPPVS
jgi:uncharacterized RmlC-like cupin family protein